MIVDPENLARNRKGERRISKRSDPRWKLFGFYVRRETHSATDTMLTVRNVGTDLSDVIETLLSDSVEQQPEYMLLKAARPAPPPATEAICLGGPSRIPATACQASTSRPDAVCEQEALCDENGVIFLISERPFAMCGLLHRPQNRLTARLIDADLARGCVRSRHRPRENSWTSPFGPSNYFFFLNMA